MFSRKTIPKFVPEEIQYKFGVQVQAKYLPDLNSVLFPCTQSLCLFIHQNFLHAAVNTGDIVADKVDA